MITTAAITFALSLVCAVAGILVNDIVEWSNRR